MSQLHFEVTGNITDFKKKMSEVVSTIKGTEKQAQSSSQAIASLLAKIGGTAALAGLAKSIVNVRGEFQKLEVAFGTMLQSEEKAATLMEQAVDFAAKTPFDLQSVASGTKQLLAYGSAAEDVIDEMRMLGDIAAGLSIPLGDIVYLFGTTRTQGRMYTMDLRQFMGRGIPLAEELAKQFGVTKDAVGELVTEGKVGFDDMNKALKAMTSEGGKFANLMEAQSKTIPGKISNLGDSIQQMLNDIGRNSEGIINKSIDAVAGAVENYGKLLSVLKELMLAYGSYKAAVILLNAVSKIRITLLGALAVQQQLATASGIAATSAEIAMAAATTTLNVAMKSLLATISVFASPAALVGVAIWGIVKAVLSWTQNSQTQKIANEQLAESLEELGKRTEETERAAESYIKTLQSDTETTESKIRAAGELMKTYPELQKKYKDEASLISNITVVTEEMIAVQARARMAILRTMIDAERQSLATLNRTREVVAGEEGISLDSYVPGDEQIAIKRALIEKLYQELSELRTMAVEASTDVTQRLEVAREALGKVKSEIAAYGEAEKNMLGGVNGDAFGAKLAMLKSIQAAWEAEISVLEQVAEAEKKTSMSNQEAIAAQTSLVERLRKEYEEIQKVKPQEMDAAQWAKAIEAAGKAYQEAIKTLNTISGVGGAETIKVEIGDSLDAIYDEAVDMLTNIGDAEDDYFERLREKLATSNDATKDLMSAFGEWRVKALADETERAIEQRELEKAQTLQRFEDMRAAIVAANGEGFFNAVFGESYAQLMKNIELVFERTESSSEKARNEVTQVNEALSVAGGIAQDVAMAVGEIFTIRGEDSGLIRHIQDAFNGMMKLYSAIGKMGEATKKVADGVKDAVDATGEGLTKSGNMVAAIVGAVLQVGVAIANIVKATKDARFEKTLEYIDDILGSIDQRIKYIQGSLSGWFVENIFEEIKVAAASIFPLLDGAIVAMQKAAQEALREAGLFAGELKRKQASEFADEFWAVAEALITISDLGEDVFSFDTFDIKEIDKAVEDINSLLFKNNGENEKITELAEQALDSLEQVKQAYEEFKATVEAAVGDISGTLYTSITDMWRANREAGIESFEAISAAAKREIASIMEDLVTKQIWATTMGGVFDTFGVELTNAITGGTDTTSVFDNLMASLDSALPQYYSAIDAFYTAAEGRGWSFSDAKDTDTTRNLAAITTELESINAELESMDAAALKSAKATDLRAQRASLEAEKKVIEDLINGVNDTTVKGSISDLESKISEANAKLQNMTEAGLLSEYGRGLMADIATWQSQLTLLNRIIDGTTEAISGSYMQITEARKAAQSELDNLDVTDTANAQRVAELTAEIAGYDAQLQVIEDIVSAEADRQSRVEELTATYQTAGQAWAAQEAKYKTDLQDAIDNGLPDVAAAIQEAWDVAVIERNTAALDEWKAKIDGIIEDFDGSRVSATLTLLLRELVTMALDGVGDTAKLDFLWEQFFSAADDVRDKYKTDEEKFQDELLEMDSDYNDMVLIGDTETAKKIEEAKKKLMSEHAKGLLEESEEYKLLTGDMSDTSIEELRRALAVYKAAVASSEDLSEEARAAIIADIETIEEEVNTLAEEQALDKLNEKFETIKTTLSSITSILTSLGVDSRITDGLNGLLTAVSGVQAIMTATSWTGRLSAIATIIGGLAQAFKSIKELVSTEVDLEAGITALAERYDKLTRVINKTFGSERKAAQNEAIGVLQAQVAEYDALIAEESGKERKWWDLFGWFSEDADKELIEGWEREKQNALDAIDDIETAMQDETLQVTAEDFAGSLMDILLQPWESYADMMNAVKELTDETIDNMLANLIKSEYVMKDVQEALKKLYDAGFTDEAFEEFERAMEDSAERNNVLVEKLQERGYLDTSDSTARTTAADTISRSITESQANVWIGTIQQQLIVQNNIYSYLVSRGHSNTSAADSVERVILDMRTDVARIASNSNRLEAIETSLNSIKNNLIIQR